MSPRNILYRPHFDDLIPDHILISGGGIYFNITFKRMVWKEELIEKNYLLV